MKPHPPELRAKAHALHAGGMNPSAVARALGIGETTAYRWLDPDFHERSKAQSRAQKKKYAGMCRVCGGPTSGCNGPRKAASICGSCSADEQRLITRRQIDYMVTRYTVDKVGVPTIAAEVGFDTASVRKYLTREGVVFRPHRRGGWTRLPVSELVDRYERGESVWALARSYGVCDRSIVFQLDGAGVKRRSLDEAMRLRREVAA